MEKYYVFHMDDDGDIRVQEYNENNIQEYLNEGYFGESGFVTDLKMLEPRNAETSFTVIIKGKIVTPKPKEVVTKYEL